MDELTLHENHLSGNCYKVRLTAALLGVKIQKLVEYDTHKGETRTPEFLSTVNSNGRVPTLQVNCDTFIPESGAACYYIAAGSSLIPNDRLEQTRMWQWMFFEQYSHEPCIAVLRAWTLFIGLNNLDDSQTAIIPAKREQGAKALDVMEQHLSENQFFVGNHISLADVALYAYTHVAKDAGFDLARWPHIVQWCARVAKQPGYISITD